MTRQRTGNIMMICGAEEPIQVNEQIHLLDEETSKITHSCIENSELNRYSFVWLGEQSLASEMFSELMVVILQQLSTPATWILAWRLPGYRPARSKWLLTMRQRQGWATYHEKNIAVATKHVQVTPPTLEPPTYSWKDEGGFLTILGDIISPELCLKEPLRSSLETLIQRGSFFPGNKLLSWLADTNRSLVYTKSAALARPSIIITGAHRLNVYELVEKGIISEVLSGVESSKVWRYT